MLFIAEVVALLIQGVVIIKDLLGDQSLIRGKKRDVVDTTMERMPIISAASVDSKKLT